MPGELVNDVYFFRRSHIFYSIRLVTITSQRRMLMIKFSSFRFVFILLVCLWISTAFAQQGEFTQDQLRTLNTFKKIDDYPLFVMRYNHDYHFDDFLNKGISINRTGSLDSSPNNDKFSCTCFASLSNEGHKIFGRNFDWYRHPTLVLFNQGHFIVKNVQ